ncbi:hypothetical protein AU194_14175 [Mycobacterium sp. GA-2829]|nr:hypothetical protein AU194_14175 [Mycobacterium sp. GA-2829]
MTAAARLRHEGRLHDAVTLVGAALDDARSQPYGVPFRDRVLLALTLADLYIGVGNRSAAQDLLHHEALYADHILRLVQQSGTPDEVHVATVGCYQLRDRAAQIALLDRPAPELDVVDWLRGEPTTLTALHGRVVLLEFWAPSCRSCAGMAPFLDELLSQHEELNVFGLTDRRTEPIGHAFGAAVVSDRTRLRYGARGVPTFTLIDRAGTVRVATSKPDKAALREAITHLLDEVTP